MPKAHGNIAGRGILDEGGGQVGCWCRRGNASLSRKDMEEDIGTDAFEQYFAVSGLDTDDWTEMG